MADTQSEATEFTENSGAAAGPDATAGGEDWRGGIADDRMREFAGRFNSPADVVKTAFEFRQKLSNAVAIPGRDADPEAVRDFHRKLGVPDAPEDYEVRLPETVTEALESDPGGTERQQRFLEAMHQAGAPPAAVQAAFDWYVREAGEISADTNGAAADAVEAGQADLRRQWGGQYERKTELARRAAQAYGDEEFAGFLERSKVDGVQLGNHPAFLRAFAAVGESLAEGSPLSAAGGATGGDPMRRFEKLTAEIHDAQAQGDRAALDRLSAERAGLADRLFGTGPIVGADNRQA